MGAKKLLAAGLAATLTAAVPVALAAPAAAITPTELAPGGTGYGGYSTGSNVAVEVLSADPGTLANLSLAQSAGAVASEQASLVTQDLLNNALLFQEPTAQTEAYGHGSGANVGLGQDQTAVPQIVPSTAEALSPPPSDEVTSELLSLPPELAQLAQAQLLPSTAQANTTAEAGICPVNVTEPISRGTAEVANVQLLSPGEGQYVVTVGQPNADGEGEGEGVIDTESVTALAGAASPFGLTTYTTQSIAPVTLFEGIPDAEVNINVLYRLQLRTTVLPNGDTEVFYGFVDADGEAVPDTEPVLTVNGEGLTTEDLFGGEGVQLSLGVADVFIGAPAYGLSDDPTSDPVEQDNYAAAAADLIRIKIPGTVETGTTTPVAEDSPLAPVLNPVLTPVVEGLSPLTSQIQAGLQEAGLSVADVRVGHLEAAAEIPAGGIVCVSVAPSDDDPLELSQKDVSALGVAPGQTFEYVIRFQNTGESTLEDVTVTDTYSEGLEFVSSQPEPASHSGNTLTYNIGDVESGEFVDIIMQFRVPEGAQAGTTYTNRATITGTYDGEEISKQVEVRGPTVIAAPISGGCDVSKSTKYASHTQVTPTQEFAYYINVANTGGTTCTNVVVTDSLQGPITFVGCSDECTNEGNNVSWTIPSLEPGASETLAVRVSVNEDATGSLPDTATITPSNGSSITVTTPGPTVSATPAMGPGKPAGCPASGCPGGVAGGGQGRGPLPKTGAGEALAAIGALTALGALAIRRRYSAVA